MDIEQKTEQSQGRDWFSTGTHFTDGWREVLSRCSHALTHFSAPVPTPPAPSAMPDMPRWALLPAELRETADEVVLRMEIPGIDKAHCQILVDGDQLRVRGEKSFTPLPEQRLYHLMECAYGTFERVFVLPHQANADRAQASLEQCVLTVRMSKRERPEGHPIEVQ